MASTKGGISSAPSCDKEIGPTTTLDKVAAAKDGRECIGDVTAIDSGDHTERRLKSRHSNYTEAVFCMGQRAKFKISNSSAYWHRWDHWNRSLRGYWTRLDARRPCLAFHRLHMVVCRHRFWYSWERVKADSG